MAFEDFKPKLGIWKSPFVGLTNFKDFFSSIYFGRTVGNTLAISGLELLFTFPATILFALLLNEIGNQKFKRTVQTISYMPHFISMVVVAGLIMDDEVIAIGPIPMMKAVCEMTRPYGIKTIVSMNSVMIDGTGMCGCCRLTVNGETRFACVDGPEFDGHQVDFDGAARRGRMYRAEETLATETHICHLTGEVR